jgi:hypothetical protein
MSTKVEKKLVEKINIFFKGLVTPIYNQYDQNLFAYGVRDFEHQMMKKSPWNLQFCIALNKMHIAYFM